MWKRLGLGRVTEGAEVPAKLPLDFLQAVAAFLIPIAVVGIGIFFTASQNEAQRQAERNRAEDAALQAYLDQMTQLLLGESSSASKGNSASSNTMLLDANSNDTQRLVAELRTSTVLRRLEDPDRKRYVVRFLSEANLIQKNSPVISLFGAYLDGANLSSGIPLQGTSLKGANLKRANLSSADLSGSDLSEADLTGANLTTANLSDADLSGATLTEANLAGALGVTAESLAQQAKSLEGATMPEETTPK